MQEETKLVLTEKVREKQASPHVEIKHRISLVRWGHGDTGRSSINCGPGTVPGTFPMYLAYFLCQSHTRDALELHCADEEPIWWAHTAGK